MNGLIRQQSRLEEKYAKLSESYNREETILKAKIRELSLEIQRLTQIKEQLTLDVTRLEGVKNAVIAESRTFTNTHPDLQQQKKVFLEWEAKLADKEALLKEREAAFLQTRRKILTHKT